MHAPTTALPASRRRRRSVRVGLVAAVITTLLSLTVVGEHVLRRSDADRYPAPGRLVALAEGSMHLSCRGGGDRTVLFEAGLGEPGLTWAEVQRSLGSDVRTCSYDRAGYGWSSERGGTWSASTAARELLALLEAADEKGPFVIVAHSLGSFVTRELVTARPDMVAGLVLIDPTNDEAVREAGRPLPAIIERRLVGGLLEAGAVRHAGRWLVPAMVDATPPAPLMTRLPAIYHHRSIAASIRELEGSVAAAHRLRHLDTAAWRTLPLIVVSTGASTASDRSFHDRLAALSDRGDHVELPDTGHYAHYDDPHRITQVVRRVLLSSGTDPTIDVAARTTHKRDRKASWQ